MPTTENPEGVFSAQEAVRAPIAERGPVGGRAAFPPCGRLIAMIWVLSSGRFPAESTTHVITLARKRRGKACDSVEPHVDMATVLWFLGSFRPCADTFACPMIEDG